MLALEPLQPTCQVPFYLCSSPIAQTQCACAENYFDNTTDSSLSCATCPDGGYCFNGTIQGTLNGYWRPAGIEFM